MILFFFIMKLRDIVFGLDLNGGRGRMVEEMLQTMLLFSGISKHL